MIMNLFQSLYFLTLPLMCFCYFENVLAFFGKIKNIIKYNSVSLFSESCDDRWITGNYFELENELYDKLFGQPLVIDVVLSALKSHSTNEHRRKPLVMSFHGPTGTGKSYVATLILKHIFKNGLQSNFARRYNAKLHFPLQRNVELYQKQLHEDLKESITRCPYSVFVFDEVDKYPSGVLDAIKPYIDYNELVDGYDYRKAIFIFITNNGQYSISQIAFELWTKKTRRDDFLLRDFEKVLKLQSFNDEGGFYRSELITSHLIDHYVAFLPLEKEHVKQCIEYEIYRQGGHAEELQNEANELLEELSFTPEEIEIFAVSGCKVVSEKVSVILEKQRTGRRNRNRKEL